jgi:hypothetical protein
MNEVSFEKEHQRIKGRRAMLCENIAERGGLSRLTRYS